VVIDGADELIAVGEALVEVALGEARGAACGPHRECGSSFVSEKCHAGGEEFVAPTGLTVLEWNAGPTASSLTCSHITPKLGLTTLVVTYLL
jgi:hypothetical protein